MNTNILPLPAFYNPRTDIPNIYLARAQAVAEQAAAFATTHNIQPATTDKTKVAVFGIDVQIDFCHPLGSLFVKDAPGDTQEAVEFIYRNLSRITTLAFSLDTHFVFQIFHAGWWVDERGNHPVPMTAISSADIKAGKWRAVSYPMESIDYVSRLEKSGKYMLIIWPYHCLLGGVGHALMPAMMEAQIFHAAARMRMNHFEIKGASPLTENYSVMSPEVREVKGKPVGQFNTQFFDLLLSHDRVYIHGQASSHCVRETILDMQRELVSRNNASLLQKIYILEDAMSPVPPPPNAPPHLDFPAIAAQALKDFKAAGMNVVKTTDNIIF